MKMEEHCVLSSNPDEALDLMKHIHTYFSFKIQRLFGQRERHLFSVFS